MSGPTPEPNGAGEPEQTFFADAALDRMMGCLFALCAEVSVLRDRVQRLESVLEQQGTLAPDALEREPDAREYAARAEDRRRFVAALMDPLLGRQVSKGG